uniref:FERM domain-containing protein n=1 Tax=Meloidogyne hapla TaxID=6305 RepID=A0A1I8B0K3_MELHA
MGVLTLNIECHERGVKKTMQFEPRTLVHDACRMVRDKLGPMSGNPNDYGLFRVEDDPTKCVWMENGRTLEYYLIRNGDTLEYKNKIRSLRVRTLDGGAVKTIFVDESQPVSQLMVVICSKMGIANHEEYSLVRGSSPALDDENGYGRDQYQIQRNDRERTPYANGTDQYDGGTRVHQKGKGGLENTFMNTIGRKKERQIQQLRAKLHTEEEIHWVDHSKTLREQNIGDEEELTLRRKFFFSDTNIDTRDPVQLNLLYIQCRDGVLRGLHPVSRDTAIKLAALQCYIEYGPFEEGIQRNVDSKNLLPKEYSRAKELEKNIIQEYRELIYEDSAAPKKKYCELCQSLPTYGVSFFLVKEKMPGKNKLIPRLLGVNKESVMRVDERTKAVLKEWPLEQVRRWAASYKTFTLDFGDYKDGYYSVQTLEGERIGQLIGGYIDIILKKKRIVDHTGIEGDEGATMVEDIVAPARATLLAHSEPTPIIAQEPGGSIYGIYRPEAATSPQASILYKFDKDWPDLKKSVVKIGNEFSKQFSITSGVPQGSILGPLLFNIYISDMPKLCDTPNIKIKLFADDVKAYQILSKTNSNYSSLQIFINKFIQYCNTNGLNISLQKCSVLYIGKSNPKIDYFIGNHKIFQINNEDKNRDLGIFFTSKFKFNKHIQTISLRANRNCFPLIKSLKSHDPKILIEAFNVYVRSILEFGSQVWNSLTRNNIKQLEDIQKRYLRFTYKRITKVKIQDIPSYKNLLQYFKVESLEHRRLKADLKLFHQHIFGKIKIKHNNSYLIRQTKTRGEKYKIQPTRCSTMIRYNSFFIRTARIYTLIPIEIRKNTPKMFSKLLAQLDISTIIK